MDGVRIPSGGGADRMINCVNPHHQDKNASLSFNVAKGVGLCHGCGFTLNAYSYLKECRGYTPEMIQKEIREHGGSDKHIAHQEKVVRKKALYNDGRPFSSEKIADQIKVKNRYFNRLAVYNYTDEFGNLAYQYASFIAANHEDETTKAPKTGRFFVPSKDGKSVFWCGPLHETLPNELRLPKYHLYNLPDLKKFVEKTKGMEKKPQIWIVEGEKCVEIVKNCPDKGNKPPHAITTLCGGSNASSPNGILKHDFEILRGQRILLLPDADSVGRDHMLRLGSHLAQFYNCDVRYHDVIGDGGQDIADAVAGSGYKGLGRWVREHGNTVSIHDGIQNQKRTRGTSVKIPNDLPQVKDDNLVVDNDEFQILGMENTDVLFTRKSGNHMYRYPASQLLSKAVQVTLAPLQFWADMLGVQLKNLNGQCHSAIGDYLIRHAEKRPKIRHLQMKFYGRGAAEMDDGTCVFNIGDSILTQDRFGMLSVERKIVDVNNEAVENQKNCLFEFPPSIKIQDDRNAARYAADLYRALSGYRWEKESDGDAFCGWIVTSIIGGALEFRPMIWLRADPGTGKTFLFEKVLQRVFGGLLYGVVDPTEAGVEQTVGNDSLPVYIDEFEPDKGVDSRQDNILKLMRQATSGESARPRGSPLGRSRITRLRFSLILASVDMPSFISEANESRIRRIELSAHGVENFEKVRQAIESATEEHKARAIVTHIIRNTANIVKEAKLIQREFQERGYETREAQMQAALTAGVRFLTGESEFVLADREREFKSKFQMLSDMLDQFVRVSGDGINARDMILGNVIYTGNFNQNGKFNENEPLGDLARACFAVSRSLGFIFKKDDAENLYVFANYQPLKLLVARIDEYRNVNYTVKMKKMRGVEDIGRSSRNYNVGPAESPRRPHLLRVTRGLLRDIGFFNQEVTAIEDRKTEMTGTDLDKLSFGAKEEEDYELW